MLLHSLLRVVVVVVVMLLDIVLVSIAAVSPTIEINRPADLLLVRHLASIKNTNLKRRHCCCLSKSMLTTLPYKRQRSPCMTAWQLRQPQPSPRQRTAVCQFRCPIPRRRVEGDRPMLHGQLSERLRRDVSKRQGPVFHTATT